MSTPEEFCDTSDREPQWQLHDTIQRVMDPDLVDDDALRCTDAVMDVLRAHPDAVIALLGGERVPNARYADILGVHDPVEACDQLPACRSVYAFPNEPVCVTLREANK